MALGAGYLEGLPALEFHILYHTVQELLVGPIPCTYTTIEECVLGRESAIQGHYIIPTSS